MERKNKQLTRGFLTEKTGFFFWGLLRPQTVWKLLKIILFLQSCPACYLWVSKTHSSLFSWGKTETQLFWKGPGCLSSKKREI